MVKLTDGRIDFLDPFFRFLNFFDTEYFFFVLIPLIWLGFSYRWGLRIFYWISLNNLVIHFAKYMVGWPRPSTDFPELGMLHPKTYGFPSGGAETCIFLGGILIYYWRTRLAWVIGIIYILLISFSRLYLGVHYPIDVLGGWVLGLIMLALFVFLKEPLENWLIKRGLHFSLLISLAIPLALMIAVPKPKMYFVMGAALGIGLGSYFSLKHKLFLPRPKNINEGLGRSFVGICVLFLVLLLIPGGFHFGKSFIAGLFMSLAASPICRWFMMRKIS